MNKLRIRVSSALVQTQTELANLMDFLDNNRDLPACAERAINAQIDHLTQKAFRLQSVLLEIQRGR